MTERRRDDEEVPDPAEFADDCPDSSVNEEVAVLCDHLIDQGVRSFQIEYAGSGDSGSTEGWSAEPPDVLLDPRITAQLVELADAWTCDVNFNNEGSHGCFRIWPGLKLVEQEHLDHIEDSENQAVPVRRLTRACRRALSRLGVRTVRVEWDGFGDSGNLDGWRFLGADDSEVAAPPEELADQLEEQVLAGLPDGCEINEGSFGSIQVQVDPGTIAYEFFNRFEDNAEPRYVRWRLLAEPPAKEEP